MGRREKADTRCPNVLNLTVNPRAWHRELQWGPSKEKKPYQFAEAECLPDLPHEVVPPRRTWPGCNDEFYPIRSEALGDVPHHISALKDLWHVATGGVITTGTTFDAPVKHLCAEKYGQGCCEATLADDEKARIVAAMSRLRNWCKYRRLQPCKFDQVRWMDWGTAAAEIKSIDLPLSL